MSQKYWEFFHKTQNPSITPHSDLVRFINMLKNQRGETVIDLGCGDGRNVLELAKHGFSVSGVDFSPFVVDIAQKRLKERNLEGHIYISDLFEEIKFLEKDSFDGVIASDAIHYVELSEFKIAIKNISHILKPNGLVFLTVPSEESFIELEKIIELFFSESDIKKIIEEYFNIKYFDTDHEKHYVIIASKK